MDDGMVKAKDWPFQDKDGVILCNVSGILVSICIEGRINHSAKRAMAHKALRCTKIRKNRPNSCCHWFM